MYFNYFKVVLIKKNFEYDFIFKVCILRFRSYKLKVKNNYIN